jgi:hypothetical protein
MYASLIAHLINIIDFDFIRSVDDGHVVTISEGREFSPGHKYKRRLEWWPSRGYIATIGALGVFIQSILVVRMHW